MHAAVGTQQLNIMDPIVTIIVVIASGTRLGKHVAQLGFRSNANFRQRLHRHILFVFRLMVCGLFSPQFFHLHLLPIRECGTEAEQMLAVPHKAFLQYRMQIEERQ